MSTNEEQKPLVFVLMPFEKEFNGLFENGIKPAAKLAGARAERVDLQKYKEKDVLERIADQIDKAAVLVGVMTGNRPSVFYEIGWAHALRKHVILLTNSTDDIPYDLKQIPSISYSNIDDALVTKLGEDLRWHLSNPTVRDKYYQAFKSKFRDVESVVGEDLMPFFVPIASRCLGAWSDFIKSLVKDGIATEGPERLEVTKLMTLRTRKYSLIEQIVGKRSQHSKDWLTFYDEIGALHDIEKTWMLCIEMDEAAKKQADVRDCWEFFHERHFTTLHCSPMDFREATGKKLPVYRVIEDFGEYVKLLLLPPDGSYKTGDDPNKIVTTIRECNEQDRSVRKSMRDCSCTMDEKWFESLPGRD
jgi:hypothetical protein